MRIEVITLALTTLDETPFPLGRGSVEVDTPTQAKIRKLYRAHHAGVPIDLWVEAKYDYDATYDPTDTPWLDAVTYAYNTAGYALP